MDHRDADFQMGSQPGGPPAKGAGRKLGLKEGDQLNVVAARDGAIEVETREDRRRRALDRMAAPTGHFPKAIASIATKPTHGERLL
jgi:antitoxin MazE